MDQNGGITQKQLAKIWASARDLGWDDGTLHEELERVIGVTSLRDLTVEHAKLLIDYMVSEGASPGQKRMVGMGSRATRAANVIPLASQAQRTYIADLLKALRQTEDSPYYLAILKRAIGRTRIHTVNDACVVIGILRKLEERYQGDAPGKMGRRGGDR